MDESGSGILGGRCCGAEENVELVRHLYESGLFDRDPEELLQLATSGR
jgi:hypothetical protein